MEKAPARIRAADDGGVFPVLASLALVACIAGFAAETRCRRQAENERHEDSLAIQRQMIKSELRAVEAAAQWDDPAAAGRIARLNRVLVDLCSDPDGSTADMYRGFARMEEARARRLRAMRRASAEVDLARIRESLGAGQ